MMKPWRPLALAAALSVTVGVKVVRGQTVVVRKAPPGSTVELVLNTAAIGSASADSGGDATLAVNLSANAGKTETDARVYVDVCGNIRRVLIVERAMQPAAPGAGCDRQEVGGLFLVRQVSTLIVNVGGPTPTVLLRQGSVNLGPPRTWSASPTGLVLFGGGGLAKFSDARDVACGELAQCSGDDFAATYTAGVAYWFARFVAAEASFVKPAKLNVDGSGDNFRFNSFVDARVVMFGGKVGVPIGPVRLYGNGGANYHQATSTTTQTNDAVTVTVDGVTQTIPGGTQTFELRTSGWGWQLGGGIEMWLARSFGLYAEAGRAALKGTARDDGDGALDEGLTFIVLGARVRIGR